MTALRLVKDQIEKILDFETHVITDQRNWYKRNVATIQHLSKVLEILSRAVALDGIDGERITQREISIELGVHENTVARWMKLPQNERPDIVSLIPDELLLKRE